MESGPILQTKLYIPTLRGKHISRPHLLSKLNAGTRGKVTLFCAAAGYGKTTLATEWLRCSSHESTWLSLDEHDNDPVRFITYFIAAINRIHSDIGRSTLSILQSPKRPPLEIALNALINDIDALADPFFIVLDDFHAIHSLVTQALIKYLVDHQPQNMHMVFLTREDPPLPLGRLRALRQLTEIRQQDLRFSLREGAEYLQEMMGIDLTQKQVSALVQRTEGWIAGLQLAALSLQGRDNSKNFIDEFTGSSRFILDYLGEEVIDQQPDEVQAFLLKTSILDRMCSSLCDAVSGMKNSSVLLDVLEQSNLFVIPLDQHRMWYRYHLLFTELLRHRLQISGDYSVRLLHQKASRWHAHNGFWIEALHHSLLAQDWDEVKNQIGMATATVMRTGQLATLSNWNKKLPPAISNEDYRLSIFRSWVYLIEGNYSEAYSMVRRAESLIPDNTFLPDQCSLLTLRSYMTLAELDIPNTIKLTSNALRICEISDPYGLEGAVLTNLAQALMISGDLNAAYLTYLKLIRLGKETDHSLTTVTSMGSLASILILQGKIQEALALGNQMLELSTDSRGRPSALAALAYMTLGSFYKENNDTGQSLKCWSEAANLARSFSNPPWLVSCLIELARLENGLGNKDSVSHLLQEAYQVVSVLNIPDIKANIAGVEAEIRLKSLDLEAVERWTKTSRLTPEDEPSHLREGDYFTFARFLIYNKQYADAEKILQKMARFAEIGGRTRSLISVNLLMALLKETVNEKNEAEAYLEKALILASPRGIIRPFLEEDSALINILTRVKEASPSFVERILTPDDDKKQNLQSHHSQPLIDPLSPRELEVLQCLAEGLPNREIGDRLVITVGTVKTHVHHIINKLGVKNRLQAVTRGRELDLIEHF